MDALAVSPGAACLKCHPAAVQAYRQTGMGRSLQERPSPLAGAFYHKASNRHYRVAGNSMERHQLDGEGRKVNVLARTATLAIGSGNHAITYAHRTPQGRLFELPVSWYAKLSAYAMSPGYDRADHLDFRREISDTCLFCHSNGRQPEPIGCERCHGSVAPHLAKPARGNILNPQALPPARQLDICLQCHLETTSNRFTDSLRQPGRDVFSYRPGEPLGDYKVHFAPPGEERFEINHAGFRLLQSRCFLESRGRMTCTTCHDPHSAAVKANSCSQCHAQPHPQQAFTQPDCIRCHQPKRTAADAIHVTMTDHRIERLPRFTDPVREDPVPFSGLLRAFYTRANPLQLERAQTRNPTVEALRRFLAASPNDAGLWAALGNALVRAGKPAEAIPALEKSLTLSPRDTNTQTYLAVAHALKGAPRKALAILEATVAANPDHPLAWINLGITHEALGHAAAARLAYDRAITLQPDSLEARRRRQALR